MFIIEWFDIAWFWVGRIVGGAFMVALAFGIFMTILEFVWLRAEKVWKSINRGIQSTKLFLEFSKWKIYRKEHWVYDPMKEYKKKNLIAAIVTFIIITLIFSTLLFIKAN